MIDMVTQFSLSPIIHGKDKRVILDQVMEKWTGTGPGAPAKFLTDNGEEFVNDEFGDVSENMSILVMNTELKVLSVMDSVKGITR